MLKLREENDGIGVTLSWYKKNPKKAQNFLVQDNTCWQKGFCSCLVSGRLFVGSVWTEDGGMEWGVTLAHEEQVWGQGVLCVYPRKKINWNMG